MPTPIRQFEIDGIYHTFNRGIEKRKIFQKQQDYARFVLGLYFFNDSKPPSDIWTSLHYNERFTSSILGNPGFPRIEDKRDKIVDILAFALMPNHFHLLLREIREGGISLFMQKMGGYTLYFNKQYDRVGPLFQGRFKTVRVHDNTQLANIFSYIHTNPVELIEPYWKEWKVNDQRNASLYLKDYRWSSYRDYIGILNFPQVTQRDFFNELFGSAKECQQFIEDWIEFKARNADLKFVIGL